MLSICQGTLTRTAHHYRMQTDSPSIWFLQRLCACISTRQYFRGKDNKKNIYNKNVFVLAIALKNKNLDLRPSFANKLFMCTYNKL